MLAQSADTKEQLLACEMTPSLYQATPATRAFFSPVLIDKMYLKAVPHYTSHLSVKPHPNGPTTQQRGVGRVHEGYLPCTEIHLECFMALKCMFFFQRIPHHLATVYT